MVPPADDTDDGLVSALTALTECASRLQSEPLKSEVGRQTRHLLQQIEGTCKAVVTVLVDSLREPNPDAVAFDQLWALRNIAKQCVISRNWICAKQGIEAVAQAMAQHPSHAKLQEEGAWLSYVLHGVSGFVQLLKLSQAMPGNTLGTMAVQYATAKALRELSEQQRERGKEGCMGWSDADVLVVLLLAALRQHSQPNEELLCECFKALNELIHEHPGRGRLFMEQSGGEALLKALSGNSPPGPTGPTGAKWRQAGIWLMTNLVTGNPSAASTLRSMGALDCLVKCGQVLPGSGFDTMWTLGQVGGPLTILRLLERCQNKEGLSVSLKALSRLTWESLEDFQDQLPEVLKELTRSIRLMDQGDQRLSKELQHALQALGGVLKFYSATVPPSLCPDMDAAVELMLNAVRSSDPDVAKAASVCLGHMATPQWRLPLQSALPTMRCLWMAAGESKESCGNLRDLMWAAGCINGLPVLTEAMRERIQCADLQHACLRAIVDLADEAEGGVPSVPSASGAVNETVQVVAAGMKLHSSVVNLQSCGCEALAVLLTTYKAEEVQRVGTPQRSSLDVPLEALEVVLHALRRFPNQFKVVEKVFLALRRFLEPITRDQECLDAVKRTVKLLGESDAVLQLRKVFQDYPKAQLDLLENACFAYAMLAGIDALLKEATVGTVQIKSAAVQALCDLCRSFAELQPKAAEIRNCAAGLVASEVTRGREGEMGQQVVELQRRYEMLTGLLR